MNHSEAQSLKAEIEDRYPDSVVEIIPEKDGARLIIDLENVPGAEHKTIKLSIGNGRSMLLTVLLSS